MKFFTIDDWIKDQDLDSDRDPYESQRKYNQYFETIKELVPTEYLSFHQEYSIYDGYLMEFNCDPHKEEVSLVIELSRVDDSSQVKVELKFLAVKSVQFFDPSKGLPGPVGFGDIGAEEIEVLSENYFEYRTLFSSGIEFKVRFNKMEFTEIGGP